MDSAAVDPEAAEKLNPAQGVLICVGLALPCWVPVWVLLWAVLR
jgi:hypothetical protein